MRTLFAILLLSITVLAQAPKPLSSADAARIAEFYRLSDQFQDNLWPAWSKTPAPLLLVTADTEYLTHFDNPPNDFQKSGDLYSRPRQFPPNLLATFPAFGPPAVIVIGEPASTSAKTSTPWLITVIHEHFHQLQDAQPGYYPAVEALGLSKGDKTGMWMLNYPFPYEVPEIADAFARLRDSLLAALNEVDQQKFAPLLKQYLRDRKDFMA
jgi:hypothetical protein